MIDHSQPAITLRDAKSAGRALKSGYLSQGKVTADFEKSMARYIGVKHALAVNSGTSALHLALLSLGIKSGDEVIFPSYVCTAVLNAVNYCHAKPVPVDIARSDFNICIESTKRKITKHTKAIIVPHIFGFAANISKFLKTGIPVIEDCAHGIGADYHNKKLGSFGALSIFSFYATKMLATGYGGMVATNNKRLAERIKNLREFDNRADYITRYNYQMGDWQAALGLSQLAQLDSFIKRRREIARLYDNALAGNTGIMYRQAVRRESHPSWLRYIVGVKKQSEFLTRLHKKGIEAKRPVFKPLHRYLGLSPRQFPVTEYIYKTAVSLPIYPSLSKQAAAYIAKSI
jgi:perosamine synthetase